ncbi:MAG: sugar phosphate nucleotidyltransferase [Candidatus Hodarchaeota archaeon]
MISEGLYLIRKVVIPAAGLGTRLLPVTKEQPKEMLPIFASGKNGDLFVKPILQVVFEQLYIFGVREFCFIVGKGKESISNHFTSDNRFINILNKEGKRRDTDELLSFYQKISSSSQVFVNQPEPRGFGDAVLRAEPYIKEPFLVQAGDTVILSKGNHHLSKLVRAHEDHESYATFLIKEVEDPRPFGIIEGKEIEEGIYSVSRVIEKPEIPPTNFAISALYLFNPEIFQALKSIPTGVSGELQLTDGIQGLIDSDLTVMAVKLEKEDLWLDISSPWTYWDAIKLSYKFYASETKNN